MPKVFIERSSSACSAASSGERFAGASGGAACAECAIPERRASAQRKGVTQLRIDMLKDASLGIRRDRETFSVRHHRGSHKAGKESAADQMTLVGCLRRACGCSLKEKSPMQLCASMNSVDS